MPSNLDPSKFYLVRGKTLAKMNDRIDRVTAGDNIQRGPGLYRRGSGKDGYTLAASPAGGPTRPGGKLGSYPWRLYNTTMGPTGQVQLNGGDGQAAQLNGFVCNVNGNPSDTAITTPPPVYPQLSVTGNGFIYAYAVPTVAGTPSPLLSLDLYYEGTMQSQDTSSPAGYYWMLVATISNYNTDDSGNVTFTVNNAYGSGYGPSTLFYCGNFLGVY